MLGELGRRRGAGAHPPVAVVDRAAQRVGVAAAEPDGQGLLRRTRRDPGRLQLPEPAVEVDPLLAPQRPHQPEALQKVAYAVGGWAVQRPIVRRASAQRDAGDQPAAAHGVDCGDLLGQQYRVAGRRDDDGRAHPDVRRHRGNVAQERQRLQHGRLAHDLLLHPDAVVAQHLGASDEVADQRHIYRLAAGEDLRYCYAARDGAVGDHGPVPPLPDGITDAARIIATWFGTLWYTAGRFTR